LGIIQGVAGIGTRGAGIDGWDAGLGFYFPRARFFSLKYQQLAFLCEKKSNELNELNELNEPNEPYKSALAPSCSAADICSFTDLFYSTILLHISLVELFVQPVCCELEDKDEHDEHCDVYDRVDVRSSGICRVDEVITVRKGREVHRELRVGRD